MTTTDRELLERAAKAAGIALTWHEPSCGGGELPYVSWGSYTPAVWNPLHDDGDALRLAVKLRIEPHFVSDLVHAVVLQGSDLGEWETVLSDCQLGDDPYAATRRAIVRAAAAMAGEGE